MLKLYLKNIYNNEVFITNMIRYNQFNNYVKRFKFVFTKYKNCDNEISFVITNKKLCYNDLNQFIITKLICYDELCIYDLNS